jgi:hypothetical protein
MGGFTYTSSSERQSLANLVLLRVDGTFELGRLLLKRFWAILGLSQAGLVAVARQIGAIGFMTTLFGSS